VAAHIATLKTELASEKERVDRVTAEFAGERAAHQEQLAAAMSQLVELARRLAAIAETAEAEPSRRGAGWGGHGGGS
jgi:hypothetical protein